jgi:hypothetical protein
LSFGAGADARSLPGELHGGQQGLAESRLALDANTGFVDGALSSFEKGRSSCGVWRINLNAKYQTPHSGIGRQRHAVFYRAVGNKYIHFMGFLCRYQDTYCAAAFMDRANSLQGN